MASSNESFKEKLGEWADKAGDYAETIRNKTNEYADKLDNMTDKVSGKAKSGAEQMKNKVRSSVDDMQNTAGEYSNRREEQKTQIENRQREFENRSDDSIRDVRDEARIVKRDAQINKTVIQRRADRFAEGVDKVADDLKGQQEHTRMGGHNHTAPIDARGDYRAVDGTVNNLNERLGEHTQMTKERMRQDAEGHGVGTYSRKK